MSLFAETITEGERDGAELLFRTGLICCLWPGGQDGHLTCHLFVYPH